MVFISMTASSSDEVPRGMTFLLNRNRLNVAVSRAKYLAVIVRSTQLTDYLPGTPDRLVELGAFLALGPCAAVGVTHHSLHDATQAGDDTRRPRSVSVQ